MKAFEKWLKEDSIESGYLYDEHDKKQRRKGWRASLEWIHSQIKNCMCSGCVAGLKELQKIIEGELES